MTDPHALVDDLERRTQELLQRAEKAKAEIAEVTGVATSDDGAATVTVSATGALTGVTFGRAADKLPKERLAESLMAAVHKAQSTAARQVTDLMTPLIGTDSAAMRLLREQLPKVEEQPPQPKHRAVTTYNEEREAPKPPRPAPPRPAPTRAAPPRAEDHDYEQNTLLRKDRR